MIRKYLFKYVFFFAGPRPCHFCHLYPTAPEIIMQDCIYLCIDIIRKIQNLPYKLGTLTGQKSWHSWILCVSCVDLVSAANEGADFPCLLVLKQPFTRSHVSVEFPIPFRSDFPRFLRLWPPSSRKTTILPLHHPLGGFFFLFFWPWIRR